MMVMMVATMATTVAMMAFALTDASISLTVAADCTASELPPA